MDDFQTALLIETYAATLAVSGALGVGLLVYWLTSSGQRNSQKAEHDAIRLALHHEVEDNLRRLESFWPRIIEAKRDSTKEAYRLLRAAVPLWSTAVWQGAAASVANALPQGQLIETYRLYTTLADVLETQRRLQAADERDSAYDLAEPVIPSPFSGGAGFKPRCSANLTDAAKTLMPDIDERVQVVLKRGNPIPR